MNRLLVVIGIIVAAFVAFFVARYFLEEGGDELIGTSWVVTGMQQKGQKIPAQRLFYKAVKFGKGHQVVWTVAAEGGEGEVSGEFRADPKQSPKHIDLEVPDPRAGMIPAAAIYDIDGDVMILGLSAGDRRPGDFSGKTGALLYLKRQ